MTDQIAKLVVSNADEKEFRGKNDVKAKSIKTNTKYNAPIPSNKVQNKQPVVHKITKHEPTNVVTSKPTKEDDEWESF